MEEPIQYGTKPETVYVRAVCLRPLVQGWEPPTAAEVLAMLRKATGTPTEAVRRLGFTRRELNRWTTGEEQIPYHCWAVLCAAGGAGQIWQSDIR